MGPLNNRLTRPEGIGIMLVQRMLTSARAFVLQVMELAALIKSKQVTSKELVDLYTARLKQ